MTCCAAENKAGQPTRHQLKKKEWFKKITLRGLLLRLPEPLAGINWLDLLTRLPAVTLRQELIGKGQVLSLLLKRRGKRKVRFRVCFPNTLRG